MQELQGNVDVGDRDLAAILDNPMFENVHETGISIPNVKTLNCTSQYCSALHYITLHLSHYATLICSALHITAQHYTTLAHLFFSFK